MSDDEPPEEYDRNAVVSILQTITPAPIRRNFAVKFGLVLLVMALSIGAIGILATQTITAETEQNVEAEYETVAAQEAGIIEQWLQQNRLAIELLADNPTWEATTEDNLTSALRAGARKLGGDVQVVHIVDAQGDTPQVVASHSEFGSVNIDDEGREWMQADFGEIQALGSGDVYVSNTYDVDGQRYVGFVTPTPTVDGRYLFMEVSVSQIGEELEGAERAEGGFTRVVNENSSLVMIDEQGEDGKLLEEYATSESALEPVSRASALRGDINESGVIAEMPANSEVIDEVYTVGYAPVEETEWVVVTHGPRSSVFGFVDTLSTWGLIVTIFAVLLIGITGSTLGYSTATSIDRLTGKTEEMRDGNLDVQLYTSRIDNIGRLYDGFADMRDDLKAQIQEAESARKEAEVARAEAEEMATYLQDKAEEYSRVMQEVGAGDLTRRMEQDGEEESMDQIAGEFNEMIEELEKTTGQLKSYVDEVEEAGREVEQSADTVREASEQVADSIQKISDDAYGQKERLQTVSETIDELAEHLESVAGHDESPELDEALDEVRQIANEVSEVAELSEETMAESENVAGAAEEQAAELNEVSERANDLQRYAEPLRDILERFDTEAEHEFVFSVGPTGGSDPSGGDD